MMSKFEDTLLRGGGLKRNIRRSLFQQLDRVSLRALRATSRPLRDLVLQVIWSHKLFATLYANVTVQPYRSLDDLKRIGPLCQHLTLKIGDHNRISASGGRLDLTAFRIGNQNALAPPESSKREISRNLSRIFGSKSSQIASVSSTHMSKASNQMTGSSSNAELQRLWADILSHFQDMDTLSVRIQGDPNWSGSTETERTLMILRIALENAAPTHLRTVKLMPIHAMGIIHLRWSAFGSFCSTPSPFCSVWRNLTTLEMRLHNPISKARSSESQRRMFIAVLQEYLRGFSTTLKQLRFTWLDFEGPSPLTLDFEPDVGISQHIVWHRLEELWLGNTSLPNRSVQYAVRRAPALHVLMMLRATHQYSWLDMDDERAWVEVRLARGVSKSSDDDIVSSFYSQHG